jgi:hypothetical protein
LREKTELLAKAKVLRNLRSGRPLA